MEEERKKGFMDKIVDNAMQSAQQGWDKCTICKKPMPPGTPTNKLYDDKIGEITVCVGCSLKAILWYARNLYASEQKEES